MRRFICFFSVAVLLGCGNLIACLWDSGTLKQERARFPNTLELITGKFPRHSPEFYRWRLQDRQQKLADDPENDSLLDDIAVSYEKLGQHAEAIGVAHQQLQRNPDRYETLANLGTFLIHDGQRAEGLQFIEKAIEVNPDAHFGREKYQRWLVMYLMQRFPDGEVTLPIAGRNSLSFPTFLARETNAEADHPKGESEISAEQRRDAVKGVLGMMRFAQHDHPVLLDVLGQLLTTGSEPMENAQKLGARCYLAIAWQGGDPDVRNHYLKLAERSVPGHFNELQKSFRAELKESESWYRKLAVQEKKWIRGGVNVEAAYDKVYLVSSAIPDTIDPKLQHDARP